MISVGICFTLSVRRRSQVVILWSLIIHRWSLGTRYIVSVPWLVVVGRRSFAVGHWSLVVGRWSLVAESANLRSAAKAYSVSCAVHGRYPDPVCQIEELRGGPHPRPLSRC